jgi:hypothetical protein
MFVAAYLLIRAAQADTPQLPAGLTCMIFSGNGAPGGFGPRVFWMVFLFLFFIPDILAALHRLSCGMIVLSFSSAPQRPPFGDSVAGARPPHACRKAARH